MSTEEFKTEHLTIQANRNANCLVTLEIKVSPVATKAAHQKAIKTINKEISIPGFRKGHAPTSYILKNYKENVEQEWHNTLLQTAAMEAFEATKTYPYSKESIRKTNIKNASLEEGAELELQFETAPDIPSLDLETFDIEIVTPKEVTEKDIEDELHEACLRHAEWEEIADRPIEEGDYIDANIETMEEPPVEVCQNTRFIVQKGKMGEWMKNLVIGKKSGDSVEGMSEREQRTTDDELITEVAFEPKKLKISILKILNPKLPPIDDELAKKEKANDIADLKEKIRKYLEYSKQGEAQENMRDQTISHLNKNYGFDVPHSLIEEEKKGEMKATLKSLEKKNLPTEEKEKELIKIAENEDQKAKRRIQLFFLATKLSSEYNIKIDQQEFATEVIKQAIFNNISLQDKQTTEWLQRTVYQEMLFQRTLDYIIDKVKERKERKIKT